jgi:thiamine biosynthesis lipoprotein
MLGLTGCLGQPLRKFEATRSMMNTFVTITVYSLDEQAAEEAIQAAFARMVEIERIASIFNEESEAFRLNQEGRLTEPSDDLRQLITMSVEYYQLTDGYFDITVQPLLDLWESGLWQESQPMQELRISETMALVGSDKIVVTDDEIFFSLEGMKITLGGIAKGYAAEEALEVLANMGIEHALVNAGGDISTLDAKPKGEPWSINLVNPDDTTQSLANFIVIDKAVATSGNYERYFDPDKEAHHIIDPKTGFSAQESISVTVVAESLVRADALATAIFAMGPEAGIELVESLERTEALIVGADRTKVKVYVSSGLAKYMSEG